MLRRRTSSAKPDAIRTSLTLVASSKFASTLTVLTYGTVGFRSKYTFTEDCAALLLDFWNWLYPQDTGGQAFTLTECELETETGVVLPVPFSPALPMVISADSAGSQSTKVYPWLYGIAVFKAGTSVYVRGRITAVVGSSFPGCTRSFTPYGHAAWQFNSATTTISATHAAGSLVVTGGTDYAGMNGAYEPVMLGIRALAVSKAPVILTGDSIIDREPCFVQSAAASTGNAILVIAHGGRSQADLAGNSVWAHYLPYFAGGIMVDDHGTNAMTDLSNNQVYWAWARSAGIAAVYHVGLDPQTGSSDGYATPGKQSLVTSTQTNLAAFEAYITSKVTDNTLNGEWRATSASIRDAADSRLWKTNGTAGYITGDGLHTTLAGESFKAAEFTLVFTVWVSGRLAPTT